MAARQRTRSWVVIIMLVALGAACGGAPAPPVAGGGGGAAGGGFDANGCVVGYDGSRDLFPTKATIKYANTLSIDYHNNYKVVTVKRPWPETTDPLRYVLVHCGTTAPALSGELAGATVVEVPVRRAAVMTTTVLPYFERFDATARVVSVSEIKQVNTVSVLRGIESKAIVETGQNEKANLETLVSLDPDVIVTVKQGDPAGLERLRQAGFKVVVNGSQSEDTALGRNEYETKLIGALLNKEADAEQSFTDVDNRYTQLATRASAVTTKPTVYAGQPTSGIWYTPGGLHWQAQMFKDSGAKYLYDDQPQRGSLQLNLEAVLAKAGNADYWFQNTGKTWESLADAKAEEPRITNFAAFGQKHIVGLRTFQVKNTGENDYWEQGVSRPDLLLQDIISLLHPELTPGHQLRFFRILPET